MNKQATNTIHFEHTDTFGGESNYSWVRRGTYAGKNPNSKRSVVREAKAFAGITGIPCRVEDSGDMLAIYPIGMCQVVFVVFN